MSDDLLHAWTFRKKAGKGFRFFVLLVGIRGEEVWQLVGVRLCAGSFDNADNE